MNWFAFFKYTFAGILTFFLLSFGGIPSLTSGSIADTPAVSVAHAQEDTTYTFMQNVNLPGFGGDSDTINISDQSLAEFVNTLIQIAIGFAILLAIIMVIAAGTEYMMSASVTGKSNAQEMIGKALGGLFLALSAVVILQTINPNLIELNSLEKINVEGEEITTPDFDDDLITNQTDGNYYCYDSDKSYTQLNWNKVCAETKSGCQDKMEIDNESAGGAVCEAFLLFNGSRDGYGDNAQCVIFSNERVDCYSEANDPDNENENVDNPEESCEGAIDARGGNNENKVIAGCAPPDEIDLDSIAGDDGTFSEEETELFQNEVLANEDSVRSFLDSAGNGGVNINKNKCESIGDSNCTNVGGIGDKAKNALAALDNQCDDCNSINGNSGAITVTGGTSWWFHSDGTEHKPGVGDPTVDLRSTQTMNEFIDENAQTVSDPDNTPCANFGAEIYYISSGDIAGCYHRELSPTHWHVEFQ